MEWIQLGRLYIKEACFFLSWLWNEERDKKKAVAHSLGRSFHPIICCNANRVSLAGEGAGGGPRNLYFFLVVCFCWGRRREGSKSEPKRAAFRAFYLTRRGWLYEQRRSNALAISFFHFGVLENKIGGVLSISPYIIKRKVIHETQREFENTYNLYVYFHP